MMEIFTLALEALEQSLLFLPLTLGIYLSYSILKTTDMTTEGSYVLGAGVFARLLSLDFSIPLASILAIGAGGIAGIGVSQIQAKNRINPLIAGIIGLFMLYSLNFQVMGRPNIGIANINNFSNGNSPKIVLFAIILLMTLGLGLLIASRFGLQLRAYGANAKLLSSLGKNIEIYRSFGLSLSNALASLCGIMAVIINGFADLNMGFGMTLTGIGTVMLGQQCVRRFFNSKSFSPTLEILGCFLGVYSYFLAVNGFLAMGVDPIYLKFLLGLLLIILLNRSPNIQ